MRRLYTISAFTENSPGVLQRITIAFTKRKVNIESLTVSETERHGISRFTIVVEVEDELVKTIVKQLNRIVEVKEVYAFLDDELVFREIAFIRVAAPDAAARATIKELADKNGATVPYEDDDSIIIEQTGTYAQILAFYETLKPFGVQEFVQSGRIALVKDRRNGITGHKHD